MMEVFPLKTMLQLPTVQVLDRDRKMHHWTLVSQYQLQLGYNHAPGYWMCSSFQQ